MMMVRCMRSVATTEIAKTETHSDQYAVCTKCQNNRCLLSAYFALFLSLSLSLTLSVYICESRVHAKTEQFIQLLLSHSNSHLFARIIYGYLYLILLIVFGLFLRMVYV